MNNLQKEMQFSYLIGPIKIKDGLFMGDQISAKDYEFIVSNKVTHIINTVSKKIPNMWQKLGVQYLSFNWNENQTNIFDKKNVNLNNIYAFIEDAMEMGESCLVHSIYGKSRACTVIAAYMMKKYSWSLEKTMELIDSKKQSLDIRANFFYQLKQIELRFHKLSNFSNTWQQIRNDEDLVMRNTYINSKSARILEPSISKSRKQKKSVAWSDDLIKSPSKKSNIQLKSILKNKVKQQQKNEHILILKNNINNPPIINKTINNFFSQDSNDKNSYKKNNMLHIRPQSSDIRVKQKILKNLSENKKQKEKQKQKQKLDNIRSQRKLPFQQKILSKINSNKTVKNLVGSNFKITKLRDMYDDNIQFNLMLQKKKQKTMFSNPKLTQKGASYLYLEDPFLITSTRKLIRNPSPMIKAYQTANSTFKRL